MSTQVLLIACLSLCAVNLFLLLALWLRKAASNAADLRPQFEALEKNQEKLESRLKDEIAKNRSEAGQSAQQAREESAKNLNVFSQSVLAGMTNVSNLQKNQLDTFSQQLSQLTKLNEEKLEKVRSVVEERLKHLQEENSQKLEKMRETVGETLHSTLEKRLGESFRLVSTQLEQVYKGLGEMQTLASGVGDLKKILSNVKTRGTFGEGQLANLLSEILTPEQYEKNVITKKGSRDPVEFAIKTPGHDGRIVYLPIDAKFPTEDYERLQAAQEAGNPLLIEEAGKALENRLKFEAKNIRDKYIDPPNTTDFAFLFLPTESLYAEVLRRPGLADLLRRQHKVVLTGPMTILALLNSLQMGFRTLAVEKRAGEIWNLLGTVKTEFRVFGDFLDKTHKKLQEASSSIEDAARKSRTIERKLKDVQELPASSSTPLLEEKPIDALLE